MFLDSNDPGIERRPRRKRYDPERELEKQTFEVRQRAIEIWNTPLQRDTVAIVYPTLEQAVRKAIEEAGS